MSAGLIERLALAGFAGLATAFVSINLGLRLLPEGRAFLAEARRRGRLIAHPGPGSPAPVRAVFLLAALFAIAAAVAAALALAPRDAGPPVGPVIAQVAP